MTITPFVALIIGLIVGAGIMTIFFLIRELKAKANFEEVWDEIYDFENRMMEEMNYSEEVIVNESKEQWNDLHEQWQEIVDFEERLLEALDDELDEEKLKYIKNEKGGKQKVDEEATMDDILTKISKTGMDSLSPEELKFLKKNNK